MRFFIALLLLPSLAFSQTRDWHFGGQLGLSLSFGTHTQRIGLIVRSYTNNANWFQLNGQASLWYNFKSLGSETKGWEASFQVGATGAWGRIDTFAHPFMTVVGNQSRRRNSLSYAYILYLDRMKTTQWSGAFGLQVKDFRFYFENDFLAFQGQDKFRTGAFGFYYRYRDWNFGLTNISWTGDPYARFSPWIEDDVFPSRSGYIDMTDAPYGDKSLGILALHVSRRISTEQLGFESHWPLDQYISADIGVDADQIRNLFQNKLIHDSKILPINWSDVKNPHIPMICTNGCPFTYHPGQEVRPARVFFQLGLNNGVLY